MIYDIRPEPTTAWGLHKNWMNWMTAKLVSESTFSKKILVQDDNDRIKERTKDWPEYDPNPNNCSGSGQRYCLKQGQHSWFNHSQDSYKAGLA